MTGVAPWNELTPQAQAVLLAELERLLERAPVQHNVPVLRGIIRARPEMIPQAIEKLKEQLDAAD